MSDLRLDLDGVRLHAVGKPDVWLIFHGRRHRIGSAKVYETLFTETTGLLLNDGLDAIEEGPELDEGTCLVCFEGSHEIFLLTGSNEDVFVHEIETYESFNDFAFNMQRVKTLPSILRRAIRGGEPLSSAPDRALRTNER